VPEGPEIANFVRSINSFLSEGDQLLSVVPLSGRYTRKPIEGLAKTQFPLTVESVGCKGKFIYWKFQNTDVVIFNTLGMSGAWSNAPRHARVKFETSEGDLFFNDARNFGTLKFCNRSDLKRKLESLGPDMLNENVKPIDFKMRMWQYPNLTLAEALMNQGIVSGVGNYLKADSLWMAKLSPHRLVSQCTVDDLDRLHESVRSVIKTAYLNGGSTILTYKGFDGENGKHTMLVYGRKTDPNGEEVIREDTKDGRTTWWVPRVQL
jgi:DNA-formamidopyrimidine glycosylase